MALEQPQQFSSPGEIGSEISLKTKLIFNKTQRALVGAKSSDKSSLRYVLWLVCMFTDINFQTWCKCKFDREKPGKSASNCQQVRIF